ncbi:MULTISPECIES: universal stress protein [unclassified Bradyrhizobium]|uniref:universal stress protein n=1 Tax=unclassified Bradyrhizobium TaxID=2631580 RepID=UPI0024B26F10|nr:universal stress protein [Bradyrhizobium sp. CB2312]WFU70584.1 universal stress protein [Bradyrhizobium sp. CB2312]
MSFASVMVYVHPEQQEEGQIAVAEGIARGFEASILGVAAIATEPTIAAEGVIIQETTAEDLERIRATLSAKEMWFRRIVRLPSEKVEWRSAIGFPTEFLAEQARAADLVVVKRNSLRPMTPRYLDSAGAMLRMGRPTLSVPDGVTELAGDRIVIGWKDTREARLAVREALPFLIRASKVTIAEICTPDEQDAAHGGGRDVANYLKKHGVSCEHEVRVHTAEPDADYLIRLAAGVGADLIVTGGYGHSRLGEWIFGGMTHSLLQQARVCLLMAH